MMIFIDIMTTIGSITEDLDPINHTFSEAGVAIPITVKASSIDVIIDIKVEVDFIQIDAILDPEVVEDHFENLIEVQMLKEAKLIKSS